MQGLAGAAQLDALGERPGSVDQAEQAPLRTILVTVGVVVATYLAGKLMYLLRDIVLLMLVAGFTAVLLNPAVAKVQRRVPRRGPAVAIVTLWAALVSSA